MKAILLLFFIFLHSLLVFSQDSITIRKCDHYTDGMYVGYDLNITRYDSLENKMRFDYMGTFIDFDNESPDFSWHDYTINDYNNSGQLTNSQIYRYTSTSGLTLLEEHFYTYDVSGNMLTDTIHYPVNPSRLIIYGWNAFNDTISVETFIDSFGTFVLVDQKLIQRDANSRPVDRQHVTFSNGMPTNVTRQLITYDGFGNISAYFHMKGLLNGWEDEWRKLYNYSSIGLRDSYG